MILHGRKDPRKLLHEHSTPPLSDTDMLSSCVALSSSPCRSLEILCDNFNELRHIKREAVPTVSAPWL